MLYFILTELMLTREETEYGENPHRDTEIPDFVVPREVKGPWVVMARFTAKRLIIGYFVSINDLIVS